MADVETHPANAFWAPLAGHFAVDEETVRGNFARYGLLDNQVRFLKGWFNDSLPNAPITQLAVLRLDGDLYESIWDALTNLALSDLMWLTCSAFSSTANHRTWHCTRAYCP